MTVTYQISATLLKELSTIVGVDYLKTDQASLQHYGRDWTTAYTPAPCAIVLPETLEQVQAIVFLANREHIALVPSGGRTGLSGAAVANNGELVVAFDRMNKISAFSPIDRTVRCQAGVITQQLQAFAEQQGLYYPVDFASSGSSQIGGNISTNAGGIKVIQYGMTREWVAGLTVVTGSGEILQLNRGLMKNNAGYDIRQLFIGAEGTLGFIVEATMSLTQPPQDLTVMVLALPDTAAIMQTLQIFRQAMDLSAFEFFCDKALNKVLEHQGLQRPFNTQSPFYVLLEFENRHKKTQAEAMALFEHCCEQGWVLDGVISQNLAQHKNLWQLRELISETISRWRPYKNDISTVVSKVPDLLGDIDKVVKAEYADVEIVWFGHIGDGNIHLNMLKPDAVDQASFIKQCESVSQLVFEIVQSYEGSISAEHGVGLLKKADLHYSCSEAEIILMQQIKQVFDPRGIMNPGKIFSEPL
ncbi:MAG: FAD-binding oxidoreductase [Pseudomonadales bacterium]|nr:FAD-binding oxidoreductase [Pseudomonadales bacterium]